METNKQIDDVFGNQDYREMLVALAGYGKHGMIFAPHSDEAGKSVERLLNLKLIHQTNDGTHTIIYCSAVCIREMIKRNIITMDDIPIRDRFKI